MKYEKKQFIGKELYLISAGMITMQLLLYITQHKYTIIATLVAGVIFIIGNILRSNKK